MQSNTLTNCQFALYQDSNWLEGEQGHQRSLAVLSVHDVMIISSRISSSMQAFLTYCLFSSSFYHGWRTNSRSLNGMRELNSAVPIEIETLKLGVP
jgi:hypothetical protein